MWRPRSPIPNCTAVKGGTRNSTVPPGNLAASSAVAQRQAAASSDPGISAPGFELRVFTTALSCATCSAETRLAMTKTLASPM